MLIYKYILVFYGKFRVSVLNKKIKECLLYGQATIMYIYVYKDEFR